MKSLINSIELVFKVFVLPGLKKIVSWIWKYIIKAFFTKILFPVLEFLLFTVIGGVLTSLLSNRWFQRNGLYVCLLLGAGMAWIIGTLGGLEVKHWAIAAIMLSISGLWAGVSWAMNK